MAGIKAFLFLIFWLLWVALVPFVLMAFVLIESLKGLDSRWKPWIEVDFKYDQIKLGSK